MSRDGRKTGGGSRAGVPNKQTAELKDMILQALSEVGGAEYLKKRAEDNAGAFMSLLGRVLPMQVNASHSGRLALESMTNEQLEARLSALQAAITQAVSGRSGG